MRYNMVEKVNFVMTEYWIKKKQLLSKMIQFNSKKLAARINMSLKIISFIKYAISQLSYAKSRSTSQWGASKIYYSIKKTQ